MRRRKRTEITVETRQLVIRRTNQAPAWCAECSLAAHWVTPEEAAALAGVSTRTLYHWVEAGHLHFLETAAPPPLICLNSILNLIDQEVKTHVTERIVDHRKDD